MLTRLRIKNFKTWRDSEELRLAPLTVLFGTNSSGKTSILQLLLMLKQTAESPDRLRPLQLGDSKTLVDLGVMEDIVFRHDLTQEIVLTIGFTLPETLQFSDPVSKNRYSGDAIDFSVTLRVDEKRQPVVSKITYHLCHEHHLKLDLTLQEKAQGKRPDRKEYELRSESYSLVRHPGRAWPLPPPVRFYGFPDEVAAYYQNAAFSSLLALALERMLGGLYYLGPLREYPHRLYPWSGERPHDVGVRGDRTIEAILAAGNRKYNFQAKERQQHFQNLVASALKTMGLIASFGIQQLSDTNKVYEVLVQTTPDAPKVKLTDVGFGLSQVLPVIVECFYVPPHSIVLFEQPEIHLHPRVQADLADLFVNAVRAREGAKPRQCQFIIESHSEHFLRRLQRRIAEGEISKDHTALYFIRNEAGEARAEPLDVDDYGNIRNWPNGFFGDEMADLVARSEAQSRRTREEAQR